MSNVLPRDAQSSGWKIYRSRFLIVGSLVMIILAAVAGLSLLPSYLSVHLGDVATDTKSSSAAKSADTAALVAVQSLIDSVSPLVTATTSPSQAIARALNARPKGVFVDHITYAAGAGSTMMLVGSATDRNAINSYKLALAANPGFDSVALPVNDLLGAEGGRFSITVSGQF